ncbi:MAG: chitobiase/beta-hexosaminidase C-terminal domain-containing protein [Bacteroidota bacterium]
MKQTVVLIACCHLFISCFCQQVFQLAPPLMKYPSVFFDKSIAVELQFREPGAVIRYTLDGSEPNEKSKLYEVPVIISTNKTTLKAKSFSNNYLPSAAIEKTFLKNGLPVKSVTCTKPNEKYTGGGANGLIDNLGGISSPSSRTWLGFQTDTVSVELVLNQPETIKEVMIDFLHAEDSWIFMPQKILVFTFSETINSWQKFNEGTFSFNERSPASNCEYVSFGGKSEKIKRILLKILPLQKIPEWHDGKGTPAWVFIDEIKVY